MVVDGTDFEIEDNGHRDWFSHKTNGAAVRYKIGTSIQTGLIVWTNGPFPAGAWPDDRIFKAKLAHLLEDGDLVHADRGYVNTRGEQMHYFTPNTVGSEAEHAENQAARARHEDALAHQPNQGELLAS